MIVSEVLIALKKKTGADFFTYYTDKSYLFNQVQVMLCKIKNSRGKELSDKHATPTGSVCG